jgi:hypothetical protein
MSSSKIGAWKLDYAKATQIKEICEKTTLTDGQIAAAFGISRCHVNHIRHERRWWDVESNTNPQVKEESVANPLKMIHDFMTKWGIEKLEYQDISIFMIKSDVTH